MSDYTALIAVITAFVGAGGAAVGALIKGHYDLRKKSVEAEQTLTMTDRQMILDELKTLRDEVRKERELRHAAEMESSHLRHRVEQLTSRLSELEMEYEQIKTNLQKCLEVTND